MKVRVDDIPPEGLDVAFSDARRAAGDLGPQAVRIIDPPRAELHLERREDMVLASGRFQARLELLCSRCLGKMEFTARGELYMVFTPPPAEAEGELELEGGDMDLNFYRDGEIDLGRGLWDETALSLPMAPLCRPDCPGLCPVCGRKAVEGGCDCRRDQGDPRWAKLARLKIDG